MSMGSQISKSTVDPGFDVRFLHMILVDGLDDSVIQRHAEIPKRGMSAHGLHKRVGS